MHELRDFLMYNLFPAFQGIMQDYQLRNLLLLQYAKILMGGFDRNPVPENDIKDASSAFKEFL